MLVAARRPDGGVRRRGRPAHAVPEDRADRRRRPTRVDALLDRLDAIGLSGAARRTGAATRWPAPASSSASWRSSTPRTGPATWSPSSSAASPTSTPRSPSTSTAAPTPAPAPRSPTSASRASWSMHDGEQVEGFQVHLGGATGLQANFGRKLRAHKVTSAGLDDYVTASSPTSWPTASRRRVVRRPGCARADEELLRGEKILEARRHERARRPLPLPLLRREGPLAARRGAHGSWECRGCLRAFSLKMLGLVPTGHRASSQGVRHDRRHHPDRPRLPRHRDRGPLPRGAARAGVPRGRRARARPGRDDHRVGRRDVRRPLLRHLLDGRRGARPPRRRRSRPASTWSSSTPATTSSRPSAPATPSAATLPSTCSRSRPCRPWPSRTRRTARTSTRPTPTCAARCARSSR